MSPTQRLLIVDDEAAIRDAVAYAAVAEGFEVETRGDGESALEAARASAFDLVVLDVILPGLSGIEVCRRLRAESDVPILILSARDAEVERVLGLEAGADDYVTKPFSMAELLSRVRAMLRRRSLDARRPGRLQVGGLQLDLLGHDALVDGSRVHLTASEFRLLALLASEPGRVVSRKELVEHLWQSQYVADERACDTHVSNIRRKIELDPERPRRLLTVRGVGYKLVAG